MEQILQSFDIHVEAYHGDDFNGKSSRLILDNAKLVMDWITTVTLERRRKDTSKTNSDVKELLKKYEQLLGKLDATLAQLMIVDLSEEEINELCKRKNTFMKLWRRLGISVTTKARLVKDHIVDQTRALFGIGGNKAEHHIEKHHQDFHRGLAVTKNINNFSDQTHAQLKNQHICKDANVIKKQQCIQVASKRKRTSDKQNISEARKEQKINVKKEQRERYAEV